MKRLPVEIRIESAGEGEFRVHLAEGQSESRHRVTLDAGDYQRLTGGKIDAKELVKRSFEFLLEREPKGSILAQFNVRVISRYFPEYESEIKSRL